MDPLTSKAEQFFSQLSLSYSTPAASGRDRVMSSCTVRRSWQGRGGQLGPCPPTHSRLAGYFRFGLARTCTGRPTFRLIKRLPPDPFAQALPRTGLMLRLCFAPAGACIVPYRLGIFREANRLCVVQFRTQKP